MTRRLRPTSFFNPLEQLTKPTAVGLNRNRLALNGSGHRARNWLIWAGLGALLAWPLLAATTSPLLAWRSNVYIAAGFAGVLAMVLLVAQPLLARGIMPGLNLSRARMWHASVGAMLFASVAVHVGGLWFTSPPDVIDALLLRSPTPFSVWGVIAMWGVIAATLLAVSRKRLKLRTVTWRRLHLGLGGIVVVTTILHALLIDGTMQPVSKIALCLFAAAGVGIALTPQRLIPRPRR